VSSDSRVVVDEISGWLEDYLRPELVNLRREFFWQYLSIYDEWYQHHTQTKGLCDQASLAYLTARAEDALRDVASDKPARLWLNVIRSLPLPVVEHIAVTQDSRHLVELVKIASVASCLYGDRRPVMLDGENALLVKPEWLEGFKQRLPVDVPRFIGAAHTWYFARGWYRIAGKGGILADPAPVELRTARLSLDALPPNAIMIVPSPVFANAEQIMPQVADYDRRSVEAGLSSVTGFLRADVDGNESQTDPLSWWSAGVQRELPVHFKTAIFYPLQNLTLITSSYIPVPDELNPHLARLAPFESLMPMRLGITFDSFGLCCRAVAATLRHQTGFMKLRPLTDEQDTMRFRAEHVEIEVERLSASFLFSVMHRGLLRAPKRAWLDTLTSLVSEGGAKNARQEVETFLELFTRTRQLDSDLEPGLFLEVDPQTLALDLLSMSEFFEFCLRRVTSLDDAPSPDARRGARFEQSAWAILKLHLGVQLVVDLNSRFRAGAVQGEIDIAFFVDDVIVVLECKSWQKRIDYFRGDRASIERRHEQLRQIIEEQTTRNVALLMDHLGLDRRRDVLAFVCVAGPEFIKQGYAGLWYGTTPRVLTPQELVALISDALRWRATVRDARSIPNGTGIENGS
jgi:hypothetical protein